MHAGQSRRLICHLLLAVALHFPASAAFAQEHGTISGDRSTDMALDLIVVRPIGLVASVIGTAGFVLALPFTLPSGSAGETAHEWIAAPLEYTFNRPLGDFDRCGADRHPCGQR